jgi:hypothetical protein
MLTGPQAIAVAGAGGHRSLVRVAWPWAVRRQSGDDEIGHLPGELIGERQVPLQQPMVEPGRR